MTKELRLQRGKANYEAKKFLDNSETIDYVKTLKEVKVDPKGTPVDLTKETKSKEKK